MMQLPENRPARVELLKQGNLASYMDKSMLTVLTSTVRKFHHCSDMLYSFEGRFNNVSVFSQCCKNRRVRSRVVET